MKSEPAKPRTGFLTFTHNLGCGTQCIVLGVVPDPEKQAANLIPVGLRDEPDYIYRLYFPDYFLVKVLCAYHHANILALLVSSKKYGTCSGQGSGASIFKA
jgi:hypothetical protein